MKAKDIQQIILDKTGLKTSVSSIKKGSMSGYTRIRPLFQNGIYPNYPFDFIQELKKELATYNSQDNPVFCSTSEIYIYNFDSENIKMKREKKPKEIKDLKVREWGSKNSQMRLDRNTARYAKALRRGENRATYY